MKKIVYKSMFFLPVLILIAVINYRIDPGSYFTGKDYSNLIADLLLSGKMVEPKSKVDLRLLQKHLVDKTPHVDIIAMGSSRTRQMRAAVFPGCTFLNCAVNQGSFEDYVAITDMLRKKNKWPHTIILGLDPWVLNENNSSTEWQDVVGEYQEQAKILGFEMSFSEWWNVQKLIFKRNLMLISPAYFQKSFKVYFVGINYLGSLPVVLDSIDANTKSVFFPDGTSQKIANYKRSVSEVHNAAVYYAGLDPTPFMEKFTEISDRRIVRFEAFVKYLIDQNVDVIFFFPPFHPATFNIWENDGRLRIIMQVEERFREIAAACSIRTCGSYNPNLCRFDESDMLDGAHIKDTGITKIISQSDIKIFCTKQ